MTAHVCQGRCPDQQLVEAAQFLLAATQTERGHIRCECQALIGLVQSARADALRAGPSWAECARINLWNALGRFIGRHITTDAPDTPSRKDLEQALARFRGMEGDRKLVHPPCADPGVAWSRRAGSREPDLIVRAITRALAAAAGPEDRRQMGMCQSLELVLCAEADQWLWPDDYRRSCDARLVSMMLSPIAVEFARDAAGQPSTTRAQNVQQRVQSLRDLLPSFQAAEKERSR